MTKQDANFATVKHVRTGEFRKKIPEYLHQLADGPIALYQDYRLRAVILSPKEGTSWMQDHLEPAKYNLGPLEPGVAYDDVDFFTEAGIPMKVVAQAKEAHQLEEERLRQIKKEQGPQEKYLERYPQTDQLTEGYPQEYQQAKAEAEASNQATPKVSYTANEVPSLADRERISEERAHTCELEQVKGSICTTAVDKSPGPAAVKISFKDKTTEASYGPVYFCDYHWRKVESNPQLFEVETVEYLPLL